MSTTMPTVEEFEAWTDEDETAAIEAVQINNTVQHIIKNNTMLVLTPSQVVYELNLVLSIDDYASFINIGDESDITAIRTLINKITNHNKGNALCKEPMPVLTQVISDYMRVVQRIQGVELGK